MTKTYTTAEAAEALGISRRMVQAHLKAHGLGEKRGRDWMLDEMDMKLMKKRLGQRGRPGWVSAE